jgi:hypothetical protein
MAALLLAGAALAAGCGGKAAPAATNNTVENAVVDGGVPDAAPPAPDAEDMSRLKMPYGAPPVRQRVV